MSFAHSPARCIWGTPKDWGGQVQSDRGANEGAFKTDPLMIHALFSPEFTEPGQHKQLCSELRHLSVSHSCTQTLAEKMQSISHNAVRIPLADQDAAVTCNATSSPFQQGLAMTASQVEGAVGSRGGRLSAFSLTWGQLPLEVEICYFVLKL